MICLVDLFSLEKRFSTFYPSVLVLRPFVFRPSILSTFCHRFHFFMEFSFVVFCIESSSLPLCLIFFRSLAKRQRKKAVLEHATELRWCWGVFWSLPIKQGCFSFFKFLSIILHLHFSSIRQKLDALDWGNLGKYVCQINWNICFIYVGLLRVSVNPKDYVVIQ